MKRTILVATILVVLGFAAAAPAFAAGPVRGTRCG